MSRTRLTEGLPAILTPKGVGEFLGLHEKTVKVWAADGKFPGAFRTTPSPKGRWRIPRTGLERYLDRAGSRF
ncbi:MAG: helix-turn-helix domain-containing protein [Planctomycetota bacterium]